MQSLYSKRGRTNIEDSHAGRTFIISIKIYFHKYN